MVSFYLAISSSSVSLLPVVDVNRVLLVAAAPLQPCLTYHPPTPPSILHFFTPEVGSLQSNTGPPRVTLALPQLKTRGNPSAMKMNNYAPYAATPDQRSISSGLMECTCGGVNSCRGSAARRRYTCVHIHRQGGH